MSGWTQSGNTGYTGVASGGAEDGTYYLFVGPEGSDGILSQTFADTLGQTLRVSGWVNAGGDSNSDLGFNFNSTSLMYLTDPATQGWTQYTFNVTGTGSDTFSLNFRDDPGFISLDNFSVVSGVPEPATWAIFLIGFGGIGFIMRRAHRNRAVPAA